MTQRPTCSWSDGSWTNPAGQPCNDDHCAMRGRCPHHVQRAVGIHTCPSCIRRTRKHLAAIVVRYALMAYDAQVDGIESEAMNLLGRAAAPEQYAERRARLAALYERRGWCDWPRPEAFRADDPHHPYAVLSRWAQALEDGGWFTGSPFHWTVGRAAASLDAALERFAHGDEFETFAAEILTCLTHLEQVDHDDRTPDLGRPCPTCSAEHGTGPKLRKRYAAHPGMALGTRCSDAHCRICAGSDDAWHCPDNPAHAWTDGDYRAKVDGDYLEHARALTADQLHERLGIKPGTIYAWASRGLVQKRGHDQHRRRLYDVADATRLAEDGVV